MALTIGTITKAVVGSNRLNYCTVTAATTGVNALTPNQVGLESIDGVILIQSNSGTVVAVEHDGTNLTLYSATATATSAGTAKLAFIGH